MTLPARRTSRRAEGWGVALAVLVLSLVCGGAASAADEAPAIDTGNTAWMLTSSALVLMMTIPGLALFYAGLVRAKNVLNVFMQCFIAAGAVIHRRMKELQVPADWAYEMIFAALLGGLVGSRLFWIIENPESAPSS